MDHLTINEIQVSYDVVNLYPSVPTKEATDIIIDFLSNDPSLSERTKLTLQEIRDLMDLCLNDCYFLWQNDVHKLDNSGPIGLALMVVVAEAFLQHHEEKALKVAKYQKINVKSFRRYVDDSHCRIPSIQQAEKFLDILNTQSRHLRYTMETENERKSLNFLDITITNNMNGSYDFQVYRKPAITNVQVKPNSGHDIKILKGIFIGFIDRAFHLCSERFIDNEITYLKEIFIENGYEESLLQKWIYEYRNKKQRNPDDEDTMKTVTLPWIPGLSPKLRKVYKIAGYKTSFKSGANLNNLLTSKNKSILPPNSQAGVYKLTCNCGKSYVGETDFNSNPTTSEQHLQWTMGPVWCVRTCAEMSWTDRLEEY